MTDYLLYLDQQWVGRPSGTAESARGHASQAVPSLSRSLFLLAA